MRIKTVSSAVLLVLIAGFLVIFTTRPTVAQEVEDPGSGFKLSPAKLEFEIEPGESETAIIQVTNVTTGTQSVVPIINDFVQDEGESGIPRLITDESLESPYSVKPFIYPMRGFTIAPSETYKLEVTFSIPENTPPGSYFGAVRMASNVGQEGIEEGNIGLSGSVGTIFLINVPGQVVEKLTLVEIGANNFTDENEIQKGTFFSSTPSNIFLRIQNEGNVFTEPFGSITIKDWSGNIVQSAEINNSDPRGTILPETIRRFDNPIDSLGNFGRYTVSAFISYGDDGSSIISAEMTFWVIPWMTLLLILAVVIAVVWFGTRGIRRYNEMILSRQKGRRRGK